MCRNPCLVLAPDPASPSNVDPQPTLSHFWSFKIYPWTTYNSQVSWSRDPKIVKGPVGLGGFLFLPILVWVGLNFLRGTTTFLRSFGCFLEQSRLAAFSIIFLPFIAKMRHWKLIYWNTRIFPELSNSNYSLPQTPGWEGQDFKAGSSHFLVLICLTAVFFRLGALH